MEQFIIEHAEAVIAVVATGIGWVLARLKDVIELRVKATANGWDDAVWEAVKKNLPQ